MNKAGIYHRPESEFAFLYTADCMRIRLRTAKEDIKSVALLMGDPYTVGLTHKYEQTIAMERTLSTETHDYWTCETGAPFQRLVYAFQISDQAGEAVFYGDSGFLPLTETTFARENNYFRMPYFQEIDRFIAPEWVKETVWYQIFPERFANGDASNDPAGTLPWGSKAPDRQDFFGGDLQGVLDHLDHLEELGINGLYFCPIFEAHSNHKYDTIDYFKVDPAFGDAQLLKQLIQECHKRGIKVMLDAVFNHMGDVSRQWQDVVQHGESSPYADWFHIHHFPVSYTPSADFEHASEISYDTFAFTPHMPKLNTANPEVQAYLLKIANYWITEFDIDAWRLDVANEVDHHFWKEFRKTCDAAKQDFYILGEIWHSSQSWLQGDEFHAVMNYAYTDAIKAYFVKQEIPLEQMVSEINNQLMLYRDQTNQIQFNVLDSHDTPRILTEAQGSKELVKQVMAFMYLQPGVPCVYYGDEFGMTGEMDPDCRKCMVWNPLEQDQQLFAFFKQLIRFRKEWQPILSTGTMHWDEIATDSGMIQLSRVTPAGTITGVFNTGSQSQTCTIEGKILLSNLATDAKGKVTLLPMGFMIVQSGLKVERFMTNN
jgi:glycosidase